MHKVKVLSNLYINVGDQQIITLFLNVLSAPLSSRSLTKFGLSLNKIYWCPAILEQRKQIYILKRHCKRLQGTYVKYENN